ncbi:hypothetical protein [Marinobacter sp. OP 3.4]|uniref:hypothetical protein n=1 Tax=Marinobacter sp. OP 3.4 TaxID=3076501 RepID=UPI002E210815
MKTPTQEQLNSVEWWDENAGSASHYCPTNKQFYDARLHPCCVSRPKPQPTDAKPESQDLPEDGALVVVTDDECNRGTYFLCEFQSDGPRFQEYPKGGCFYPDEVSGWTDTGIRLKDQAQPESQEWVDGLPPVGVEVELREPLSPCAYRYFTGRVVGYDEEMSIKSAVCRVGDEYHAYKPSQLRPLKTDAERGREEVCSEAVKVAHQAIKHFGISGQIPMATIMTALYDAGMLRKGGDQS